MSRVAVKEQIRKAEESLREVLIELEQRKHANPLAFFIPNGKQEKFLKLPDFVNVFSTGNGVGKTMVAVNIVGNLVYGPQSEWFNKPVYNNFKRPNRGRIVSTHKNIKESLIPKLNAWFPKGRYFTRKEKQEYDAKWFTDTGCEFDIMTYDTDIKQFEGPTIHWHLFDEPPPALIFGACVSRMREGGIIFITMTSLYTGGWIFDRVGNPWRGQSKWFFVTGEIEDNCIEHGVRGTLRHEDIERMIEEYPAEEKEARIKGTPIYLSGRVYKTYDPEVHELERVKAPKEGILINVCDPHDNKPFALGWYIVDAVGDMYVIEEWPNEPFHEMRSSSLDINDYGKIIEEKERDLGRHADVRIIDARYGNRKNMQTGETIRDAFDDYKSDEFPEGICFINSYTDDNASILVGHQAVKELLKYDKDKPLGPLNRPKLMVCKNCTNHRYGFLHYGYKTDKNPDKATKETVDDKAKDFMDLVRYGAVERKENLGFDTKEEEKPPEEQEVPERWKKFREPQMTTGY